MTYVSAGYAHSAVVTDTGALYTFGKASDGALGHDGVRKSPGWGRTVCCGWGERL